MFAEIPDLVIGILFFSILIIVSIIVGKILQVMNKSRNARAISALAPLIQGEVDSNEHSAWISGNFRGRLVRAAMTPDRNISNSSDYSIKINSFELSMLHLSGAHSWEIVYTGILRKKWKITTLDGSFKERLRGSGLIAELERIGNRPSMGYNAREAVLWYHEDIRPRVVPTPKRFQAQLKLLYYVAEVNDKLNVRPVGSRVKSNY